MITKYLKDYLPPNFHIEKTILNFAIYSEFTTVKSELHILRNSQSKNLSAPLVLDGENLDLQSIKLNDVNLTDKNYKITATNLIIEDVSDQFILQTEVTIKPQMNKALYGLY